MRQATRVLIGFAGFLLLWQGVVLTGFIPEDYLPGVPAIVQALIMEVTSPEFWMNEAATLGRAAAGLLIAVLVGGGLAIVAARFRFVERMLQPLIDIVRSLPPAALVPLAIFALGLGPRLYLSIIAFAGVSVVYITTQNALRSGEPVQMNLATSLGYSRWQTMWQVRLPAALPEIFSGIRLAAGASLIASVAVEMLAGSNGIGFMLYDTAFSLRSAETFALLGVAGMNGVLFNAVVVGLRRHFSGWQQKLSMQAGT